jgi:hypothetical protein
MPTLRAAIAPNTSPTATAMRIAAMVAGQGAHAAGDPPSAATRFANAMPATP